MLTPYKEIYLSIKVKPSQVVESEDAVQNEYEDDGYYNVTAMQDHDYFLVKCTCFKQMLYRYVKICFTATTVVRNYRDKCEIRCCFGSHKQCKTRFKGHMARLKIISLYIYKDLRLRILRLMSHVTINTRMAT